ncbi:MAG: hypothetical protein JJW00_04830 [Sulfurimonas sp.]|nr:hypothetical protein [Sulfurimonas sp.]
MQQVKDNEEVTKYDAILFNKIMSNTNYAEQAKEDKEKWMRENENILDAISFQLNSILNKFNLKLAKEVASSKYKIAD